MALYRNPDSALTSDRPGFAKLVQRIREEFEEAPGLVINVDEGARFWALDRDACELVLARLHDINFLMRTGDGRYRQSSAV